MSDYNYLPASDGTGDASLMHITANRAIGTMILSVDSVIGVPAKFIGTAGTLLSTGFIDPTTKIDFKGHVSGATLVIDAFEPGSTDAGNVATQVVVVKPTTGWANRVANFIMNATGFGTPENVTHLDVAAATLETTGAASIGGALSAAGLFSAPTGISATSFALNMKSAESTGGLSFIPGDNNLSSLCSISFTVAASCKVLVFANVSAASNADFELQPEIYLDGALAHKFTPAAAIDTASQRGVVRSTMAVLTLAAGAHTISPGAYFNAASSIYTIQAGGVEIAGLVLGQVTA